LFSILGRKHMKTLSRINQLMSPTASQDADVAKFQGNYIVDVSEANRSEEPLVPQKSSGTARQQGRAVILTALSVEYEAIRERLENPQKDLHQHGTRYEIGVVRAADWSWSVALAEIGPGNQEAATQTERALEHFKPQVILFVGIAGGLDRLRVGLGDVVIGTKVYNYHSGRAGEEFEARPQSMPISHRLEQLAREVKREWLRPRELGRTSTLPRVHLGAVAAGEVLIDSSRASIREFLRTHYQDAIAVEMESAGFLTAVHLNDDIPALVIRGISDLADRKRRTDARGNQQVAARNAAAFAVDVLKLLDPASISPIHQSSAPARSSRRLAQLPPDIADFTGRQELLNQITRQLTGRRSHPTALVISAIAGMAGLGKTALAIHAGHHLTGSFPDGQIYVNLRGMDERPRSAYEVLGRLLRDLGVPGSRLPSHLDERSSLFRSLLGDKRLLVLLDNARDSAQIAPLLPGRSHSVVMITSRTPLSDLAAEHITLDVFTEAEALELLRKIGGRQRVDDDLESARAVVRFCGYLPLAIRIAGARLGSRSVSMATLLELLVDERKRLDAMELRSPRSKVTDHERSVRASFTLSYEALDDREQQAFRCLGVLDLRHFPAWVGAAVLDTDRYDGEQIVAQLVERQLIGIVTEKDEAGQMRYEFHDLVRVFARERFYLEARNHHEDRKQVVSRVIGGYLALAERANGRLELGGIAPSPPSTVARWDGVRGTSLWELTEQNPVAWFTAEQGSLIDAARQAADEQLWTYAWELVAALPLFFDLRANWDQWQSTHELALRAAERDGDKFGIAKTAHALAAVHRYKGHWDDAMALFERSLRLFQEIEEKHYWPEIVVSSIGRLYLEQGRWSDALDCYGRCLPVFQRVGNRRFEAYTLRCIGVALHQQGNLETAAAHFESSLRMFRDLGDKLWQGRTLLTLGDVSVELGQFDRALECYSASSQILDELGDRLRVGLAMQGVGRVHRHKQNWAKARISLNKALRVFRDFNDPSRVAPTLLELGFVNLRSNRLSQAEEQFKDAKQLYQTAGHKSGEAKAVLGVGEVLRHQGRLDEAVSQLQHSVELLHRLGEARWEARARGRLGLAYGALGNGAASRREIDHAITIYANPSDMEVQELLEEAKQLPQLPVGGDKDL
jgi:nucleoside phosphorylase/tetratricopeptide (TPR) repeat protein